MKKLLFLLVFLPVSMLCSGQTMTALGDGDGTVTVRYDFTTKSKKTAQAFAERYVIETLIYRGIPGTKENKPMVGTDEVSISEKHKEYLKMLLDEKTGRYNTFIVASSTSVKKKQASSTVTVNTRALREDLKKHGVIRRFGF